METIHPDHVHCLPGKILVEITEVLGGMKNGIYIPGTTQDHGGKDTAMGRVLQVGARPWTHHIPTFRAVDVTASDTPWPEGFETVEKGEIVAFPRDVPKVFTYEDKRYAVIHWHEILFKCENDEVVEVLPREIGR